MEATILEAPDPEGGNKSEETTASETQETQMQETTEQPVEETQATEETKQEEPTIEFEGQRLTASQIKEWKEAADNKKEWQKANTQRAQEIAEERKRLSKLSMLEDQIAKNPQVLQELFKPQATRNIDNEIAALYQAKPQDPYSQEYANWEYNKDRLIAEKVRADAEQTVMQKVRDEESRSHNFNLGREVEAELKAKGRTDEEIAEIGQFVVENMKPVNGKYDKRSFEIAEAYKYGPETIRKAKVETAKQAAKSIVNAKPATGVSAVQKPHETKDELEREDDAFISIINERNARK